MEFRCVVGKGPVAVVATLLLAVATWPIAVQAQTTLKCPPNSCCFNIDLSLEESGDLWYGPSNWDWARGGAEGPWITQMKRAFGIYNKNWGESWRVPTTLTQPMGRAFTAIVALTESSADPGWPSAPSDDYTGNLLRWGGGYAARWIDNLQARCKRGDYWAYTTTGPFVTDRVELYIKWFQGNAAARAGLLLHESRHWAGFEHNAGNDKKDSSFDYQGAWAWHAAWMNQYAHFAVDAPQFLRCSAWRSARRIMREEFATDPGVPTPPPDFCR